MRREAAAGTFVVVAPRTILTTLLAREPALADQLATDPDLGELVSG